ncbi:hypothetical protein ASE01_03580 [Nocardioides sp. Root190]|uniref:CAP domain-containing protein n=1 Tax=Nocardioides sp. Root190 TaxID=1736488 RepID=UPI0006FFDE29|nr:CAP domain-containing protein [Nocardioides sp. Root190]KRB78367.1 hypothetical protein ASE01_03580 [Nocardioides sp. Root190]
MNRGIRNFVIGALVVAAAIAPTAVSPAGAATEAATVTSVRTVSASTTYVVNSVLENAVVALVNTRRVLAGCPVLKSNSYLRASSRKHSRYMAVYNTMSHRLPGEPTLGRRITAAGYTNWNRIAENVAAGFTTAQQTMRAWMGSTGHRRNILDCSLRHIGVGVVFKGLKPYWTQNFGRRS